MSLIKRTKDFIFDPSNVGNSGLGKIFGFIIIGIILLAIALAMLALCFGLPIYELFKLPILE